MKLRILVFDLIFDAAVSPLALVSMIAFLIGQKDLEEWCMNVILNLYLSLIDILFGREAVLEFVNN